MCRHCVYKKCRHSPLWSPLDALQAEGRRVTTRWGAVSRCA